MTLCRVIDTETCSLEGGIVEVGAVDITWPAGVLGASQSHLVKPDRPITYGAMAVHHITEAMVADQPPLEDVIGAYKGADYYVAHNANFDSRVLPDMGAPWICTYKVARRLWPDLESHSNQFLRYALQLEVEVPEDLYAHRALYDCFVTAALFKRITEESGMTLVEMQIISELPALLKTVPFGKHKGKTFQDVLAADRGWLQWALNNIADMSEDLRYTINYYLGK